MKFGAVKTCSLGIIFYFLSTFLYAESTEYIEKTSPEHGAFILIEHFSAGIKVEVNSNEIISASVSRNAPLAPKLIFLPSAVDSQIIKLTVSSTSFEDEPVDISVTNILVANKDIVASKSFLALLSEYVIEPTNNQKKHAFEQHYQLFDLDVRLDAYVTSVLIDTYINASMWNEAWELIDKQTGTSSQRIASKCHFLSRFDVTKNLNLNESFVSAAGQLAYELYIYRRHRGDLLEYSPGYLGDTSYPSLCEHAMKRVATLQGIDLPPYNANNWPNDTWPNILFKFVLKKTPNFTDEVAARLLQYVWIYFNFNRQHQQAEQAAKDGIARLLKSKEQHVEIVAGLYNSLFISQLRLGAFSDALNSTGLGLTLAEALSDQNKWKMFFNAGLLNDYLGEFDIATRYYRDALRVYVTDDTKIARCKDLQGDLHQVGYAITMIGSISRKLGHIEQAKSQLSCGLGILQKIDSNHTLVAHIESAKLALKIGDAKSANEHALAVISNNTTINVQMLDAWIIRCNLTKLANKFDEMETCIKRLASLLGYLNFSEIPKTFHNAPEYPIRHFQLLQLLMQLHSGKGEKARALAYGKSALTLSEVYNSELRNPQAWKSARYQFVQSYMEIVLGNETDNPDTLPRLFELLEGPYSMEPQSEKSIYSIAEKGTCWSNDSNESMQPKTKQNYDVVMDGTEAVRLSALNCLSQRKQIRIGTLKIHEVQERISDQEAFLRYFHYQGNLHVLIVSQHDVLVKKVSSRSDFSSFIHQYANVLANQFSQKNLLNFHADNVFPSNFFEHSNNYKRLIIVPDDELTRLPFAALNISNIKNRYSPLVENSQVVFASSASSYFADIRTDEKDFNLALFGAPHIQFESKNFNIARGQTKGDSVKDNRFPFLRGALKELQGIASLFSSQSISLGILEQATNQFLMSQRSRQASILHIATHGYVNNQSPNAIGIVSSKTSQNENGEYDSLSLTTLLGYPISNQLVVISGCDTQQGKLYKGSGIRSMTRGFLSQGAGAVIGTLWPIQDNSTAKFMTEFYRQLKLTKNSAEALRRTQVKFSRSGRYKAPKYWAGFVLNSSNRGYEQFANLP